MIRQSPKVIFFGTPEFAAFVLDRLVENGVNVVAVISKPDKPQGRSQVIKPTSVKEVAVRRGIPLHQPIKVSDPAFAPILKSFSADLFVVVAYGEILTQAVLDIPKSGSINLHASLLPKYRGAAPMQWALIQGEKETGISIIHMVRKMDAGNVIVSKKIDIPQDMNAGELAEKLRELGVSALLDILGNFHSSLPLGTAQDESLVTFAPKIELEQCQVDWGETAEQVHNKIRGRNPEPISWCWLCLPSGNKRLKIYKTCVVADALLRPGQFLFIKPQRLLVGCGKGAVELIEVQPEGKNKMKGADFFRGLPSSAQSALEE